MFGFSSALTKAILIKRYKRFLADVEMEDGSVVTVHCPNTGAMTTCADPGCEVFLSKSSNPKRKYKFTWEYSTSPIGHKICVNTHNANRVVLSALHKHRIPQFNQYSTVLPEHKINDSRIDFLLQEDGQPDCYLEVKSATLAYGSTAMFPDTITKRGLKHCEELSSIARNGDQAYLLFCVMREGIESFEVASEIDPKYARAVEKARDAGVNIICFGCRLNLYGIELAHEIPFFSEKKIAF